MRYLLASDLDGTLYVHGRNVQKNIDAINRFRKEGHLFGIVTGRDYVNGYLAIKNEGLYPFDFAITSNGAQAVDAAGNTLFSHSMRRTEDGFSAVNLVRLCMEEMGLTCGLSLQTKRFNFHPDYPEGGERDGYLYSPLSAIEDVDVFVSSNVVAPSVSEVTGIIQKIKERFGKYMNPMQNGQCIDITPIGVDKASGVADLAAVTNILPSHVWVVGDNYNDLPMIEAFHGGAMKSGVPLLQTYAEYTCEQVADLIDYILQK